MGTYFESVPNVTTIEGSDEERLVTQKLEVTDRGVRLLCRGGVMGGPRDIDLGFGDIVSVDQRGEYTYELVLRTGDRTYTVTNVTSNGEEMAGVVGFIRERIGGRRSDPDPEATDTPSESPSRRTDGAPNDGGTTDTTTAANGDTPGETDVTRKLRRFADLRDEGILTEEEFERKKQQLLESEEW